MIDINLYGKYITCGDKQERIIPFGSAAKRALKAYLDIRDIAFNKKNKDYLFLNSHGEQLSRQGFWKILKEYAKRAGIEEINPNTIRHSFAAHMLDNGADIGVVQRFLGYTDFYMTYSNQNIREVYMKTHPRA